jgi:hypothetical protein
MAEQDKGRTAALIEENVTCTVPWGDDRAYALALEFQKFAEARQVKVAIRRGDDARPGIRPPGIH